MNILDDDWPQAIDESFICRNAEDEMYRAQAIVELLIDENLNEKKFLDFNLSENYCVNYVNRNKKALFSAGLYLHAEEKEEQKLLVTSDYQKIVSFAPYDIILAFDVFNHLETDIDDCFKRLYNIIAKDGFFYLRTHPYSSRHATHFYKEENKAYMHYVKQCGVHHNKINIDEKYLESVGFSVITKRDLFQPIENYFTDKFFYKNINEIQFTDYKLRKIKKIFI